MYELCCVMVLYIPMMLQILYCWHGFTKVLDGGNFSVNKAVWPFSGVLFRVFSPLYILYIFHQRRLIASNPSGKEPTLNHFPRIPQFLYANTQSTTVESLLFRNEAVNITLLVFTLCFPDFYAVFNETPIVPHFFIVFLLFITWKYYKNCSPRVIVLSRVIKTEKIVVMALIACVYIYNQVNNENVTHLLLILDIGCKCICRVSFPLCCIACLRFCWNFNARLFSLQ